jgi:hypothetical protein
LVAPEQGDVIKVEEPGQGEENDYGKKGPEENTYRESARERLRGTRGMAEEYSAEEGDAGSENDTSDGGDEALFPSGGGEEESGVDERE